MGPFDAMAHIATGSGKDLETGARGGRVTLYVTAIGPNGVGGRTSERCGDRCAPAGRRRRTRGGGAAATSRGVPITPGGLIAVYGEPLGWSGQSTSLPLRSS